jgi:anti-sigma factor RsiW
MHNCKLTRSSFIDLALGEIEPARATQLRAELNDCPGCHEEYESLRSTLHVSNQALRSAVPGEEFWPGYRTRLHAKLLASPAQQVESADERLAALAPISLSSQMWLAIRKLATTSVRVPVPAALALLLVFGVFFFVLRGRQQVNVTPSTPVALVNTRKVEVPVIQEKVVTRVVYVEKKGRRSTGGASQSDRTGIPAAPNTVAVTGSNPATALSLVGFEPTNEVKLTVIKGSYKDEKR